MTSTTYILSLFLIGACHVPEKPADSVEDYTARPIIYESVFSSHNRPLAFNPIFDSTLAGCIPQGFPIRIGPSSERLYCRDWVDYMGIPHSILLSLKLKARDISKKKFDGFYNYYTTYLPVILNNNILYTDEEKLKNLITIRFPDYGTIYRIDAKTAYTKFGINCMHGALIIDSLPQFEQRKIKAVFEKDLPYPTYRGREKNFPQKENSNREKSSNFK